MRQIRFRFDGQPINETDTPAQVKKSQSTWCEKVEFGYPKKCFKSNPYIFLCT